MKKVYEVEIKGQNQKYYFDNKQQAEDYAGIQAVFGGKKYRIQAIFVAEEKDGTNVFQLKKTEEAK